MNIALTKRKTCRLCESPRLELVVPLAPTPVAEKYVAEQELSQPTAIYPLDLHLCLDCGHVQLLDVVDPKFLFDNYTYMSGNTKPLVQHFDECAETTLKRYEVKPDSLIIDIGSNDGSLLRCFKNRGMRVLGVDPATEIAARATQQGIPTIPDFLTRDLAKKIRAEHGPATVVCAFNVFAHADNLAEMADSIRQLLAPNGLFLFEFSYLLDIIDRMLLGTIFHEHLSHHSVKPMSSFLARHGLELIDCQRNNIQGGSVVGTAQLLNGPHKSNSSVKELLEIESQRGLDKPEIFHTFSAKLKALKSQLSDLTTDLKRQGKTIWGYGAARSGTTLISQMNLGKTIQFIVDDGPDKQNKFSPGEHIKILPSRELYEKRPDYIIILAWVHAQRIIENNRKYLESGGRFILCFPEIQIIDAAHGKKT